MQETGEISWVSHVESLRVDTDLVSISFPQYGDLHLYFMQKDDMSTLHGVHERSFSGNERSAVTTLSLPQWKKSSEHWLRHEFSSHHIHVVGGKDSRASVAPTVDGWSARDLIKLGIDPEQQRQVHGKTI